MLVNIYQRYLQKAVTEQIFLAWFILMVIIIGDQLVVYLTRSLRDQIPLQLLGILIGYQSLAFMPILISLACFFAILLALGKLSRDKELTALAGFGVSRWQQWLTLLPITASLCVIVVLLSHYWVPRALSIRDHVLQDAVQSSIFFALSPNRIAIWHADGTVVFTDQKQGQSYSHILVFHPASNNQPEQVMTAQKAIIDRTNPNTWQAQLRGVHTYQTSLEDTIARSDAETMVLKWTLPALTTEQSPRSQSDQILFKQRNQASLSELYWRMVVPFFPLIFSVWGILLAPVSLRGIHYVNLGRGFVVALIYLNGVILLRSIWPFHLNNWLIPSCLLGPVVAVVSMWYLKRSSSWHNY